MAPGRMVPRDVAPPLVDRNGLALEPGDRVKVLHDTISVSPAVPGFADGALGNVMGRVGVNVEVAIGDGTRVVTAPHLLVKLTGTGPAPNAAKDTKKKRRWSLVPMRVFAAIIDAMQWAVEVRVPPYEEGSWRTVKDWKKLYGEALLRHWHDIESGEKVAPDSKLSHLWHMGACIAIMIARELEEDDAAR